MRIACLGWGSLVWKPVPLPVMGGWHEDGPEVPIEFSRVGDGGELATAICVNAPLSTVLWSLLDVDSVAHACAALQDREKIPADRVDGIGSLIRHDSATGPLGAWAAARGIDAVIWTALPPRFRGVESRVASAGEVIEYLTGLTGDVRAHARDYIQQMPQQIDTPYRRAITQSLGWE